MPGTVSMLYITPHLIFFKAIYEKRYSFVSLYFLVKKQRLIAQDHADHLSVSDFIQGPYS